MTTPHTEIWLTPILQVRILRLYVPPQPQCSFKRTIDRMFDHYILLLHLENSSTEHTTNQSMSIADFSKPYLIEVDSSANTVGAALLQSVEGQGNRPIAFASLVPQVPPLNHNINLYHDGLLLIYKEDICRNYDRKPYINHRSTARIIV